MKGRLIVAAALLAALWSPSARAQNMAVSWDYVGASSVRGDGPGPGAGVTETFSLTGGYPVILDGARWVLIPGLVFRRLGLHPDGLEGRAVYALGGSFTVFHRLAERWGVAAHARMSHQSDLTGHDGQAWAGTLSAVGQWFIRKGHRFGFGAALSYAQGRWVPVPIVQWIWRNPDWSVDVLVPQRLRGAYRITETFDVGPEVRLAGGGGALYDVGITLRSLVVSAGVSARMKIVGPVYASAFGGLTLLQRFDVTTGSEDLGDLYKAPAPTVALSVQVIPD